MRNRSQIDLRLLLTCVVILSAPPAWAAAPGAIRDRAVDMVTLVSGEQFLGMFAVPPADGTTTLYVDRDWLQQHEAAYYRKLTAGESDRRKQALEQYIERLTEWRDRRAEPKILNDFLRRSLRDVEARLKALDDDKKKPDPSQLVIVEVPAKQVRRFFAQPLATRRLLALAWESRTPHAEDVSAAVLTEQLKKQKVDVEHAEPDLSDRFDVLPLSPRQWAAKVALVEFEILGKPRFQGTGSMLVEDKADGGRPAMADLLGGLLQDQLGDALGDLLNPQPAGDRPGAAAKQKAAVEKALASAAKQEATGVRITYLDQDVQNLRATVTDTFYAFMPDKTWQSIWQKSSAVAAGGNNDLGEDELAAKPEIAEIMKTLKGLGLDANQDLLKSALRFGGATLKAMQNTDRDFSDFLLSQTRRLIGPPVYLPD